MYSKDMKQYCDAVGKTPTELLALKIEGLRNVATEKEFQAEDLLDNYLYNTPDVTVHIKVSILCAVKSFYKANWRELNSNVGKNLSLPEPQGELQNCKTLKKWKKQWLTRETKLSCGFWKAHQ